MILNSYLISSRERHLNRVDSVRSLMTATMITNFCFYLPISGLELK